MHRNMSKIHAAAHLPTVGNTRHFLPIG